MPLDYDALDGELSTAGLRRAQAIDESDTAFGVEVTYFHLEFAGLNVAGDVMAPAGYPQYRLTVIVPIKNSNYEAAAAAETSLGAVFPIVVKYAAGAPTRIEQVAWEDFDPRWEALAYEFTWFDRRTQFQS